MNQMRKVFVWLLLLAMIFTSVPVIPVSAEETEASKVVIDVTDHGADPSGLKDSTEAIWQAFEAAKEASNGGTIPVTVNFPTGEYHIYKDTAQKREYHTSNTSSTDEAYHVKTIGILVEDQKNLTIEGNGSLFMMHGDLMALAVVRSENIKLHDFSWDYAVPTVTEMTVLEMGDNYTDYYIPQCFPYEISGNTILWKSDVSPYTGKPYWTKTGIHENSYSVVAYHPDEEMSRAYGTSESPFKNATSIEQLEENIVRIHYSSRPSLLKEGMVFQFCSSAVRPTAGAFTWESKDVTAEKINIHFMDGFGWLIQMSENVYYYNCNLMPREDSGHITVSYADGIHASGAAGKIVIEGCNFSFTHDDPINIHGTFTRVEQRIDDNTLELKYIHQQQGGFPQYHVGDKVQFFTRDTLESTDNEKEYTVSEIVSNPGEQGNDLKTMVIKFEETLPEDLSDTIGGQPKYVAENTTYAPKVEIRNCTFKNIVTRGILCTTRNKVLIENNIFYPTSMATIFLSNDSNDWYESGPIRDMTIRGNTFYVKDIGGKTSWKYASAIYIHPVTKGGGLPEASNPVHKNIIIEDNTFYMDDDAVVKAESVENLQFKNNTVLRMNPDVSLTLEPETTELTTGNSTSLNLQKTGNNNYNDNIDNLFDFVKSKDVVIEGNTYDDGLKRYVVDTDGGNMNLQVADDELTIITSEAGGQPSDAVGEVTFVSSDPEVVCVDKNGNATALKAGNATVYAYYKWNGTYIQSNEVTFTVTGEATDGMISVPFLKSIETKKEWEEGFTVKRENPAAYEMSDQGYVIHMETGDLYQSTNSLKNLLLYDVSDGDFSAIVKVEGMPVREGNQWDTASFILYKDDDNYITIGKKSHKDGFCYVVETGGTATETDGKEKDNSVTSGYLKITKADETVTLYAKVNETDDWGDAVATITSADAAWLSDADLQLGFGAWHTNDRGNKVTFSDLKVAVQSNEFTSVPFFYDTVEKTWTEDFEMIREDAEYYDVDTNSYTVTMQAGDLYGIPRSDTPTNNLKNLLLYDVSDGDFSATVKVEGMPVKEASQWDTASFILYKDDDNYITIGKKSHYDGFCYVVETGGTATETGGSAADNSAASGYLKITKAGETVTLYAKVNETDDWGDAVATITAADAAWLSNADLKLGFGAWHTNDRGNKVTFSDLKIKAAAATPETMISNHAAITNISLNELGFTKENPTASIYYVTADGDKQQTTLSVTKDTESKEIQVLQGEYRKPLTLENHDNTYTGNVELVDGLNTFYVRVYAEDGITYKQHILSVVYMPDYVEEEISDGYLKEVVFDGTDITSGMIIAGKPVKRIVTKDTVSMSVKAKEGATVTFGFEGSKLPAAESSMMERELTLSKSEQSIKIVITADNREKTYYLNIEKSAYLSDMEWLSATAGYGNVNKDANSNGSTITLTDEAGNPIEFEKGIGTHAESVIQYNIQGLGYDKLQGYVGIDRCKYGTAYGDAQFIVLIDDVPVFDSGVMGNTASMKKVDITIPDDAEILELRVLKGDPTYDNWNDHANWADMRFVNITESSVEADKSGLEEAIKAAGEKEEADYTADSWAVFAEKLEAAKIVNDKAEATQEEVDAALKALNDALAALVKVEEPDATDPEIQGVTRIAGAGRIDTGLAVADTYKELLGVKKFETVIIATGGGFADALTGSYLAYVKNAPIILTSDARMSDVVNYVKENLTAKGKVYILGGKEVVKETLDAVLREAGYDVERLAGANRYETNLLILQAAGVTGGEFIIATGKNFADSLSASAVKKPILLVKDSLSDAQKAYLAKLDVEKFYIVGGKDAVVPAVEAELKVNGAEVKRIAGNNRRETSVKIAETFFTAPKAAVAASAGNFPDGLCGGPLAAVLNAPLILTADNRTTDAKGYMAANDIDDGYVLGGIAALTDESVVEVFYLKGKEEIHVK